MIQVKYQSLLTLEKKLKMSSAVFFSGTVMVKMDFFASYTEGWNLSVGRIL